MPETLCRRERPRQRPRLLLPDDSAENIMSLINRVLANSQIIVTQLAPVSSGPLSPLRKDILAAVEQRTGSMWPDAMVTSIMSTGASDGNFFARGWRPGLWDFRNVRRYHRHHGSRPQRAFWDQGVLRQRRIYV